MRQVIGAREAVAVVKEAGKVEEAEGEALTEAQGEAEVEEAAAEAEDPDTNSSKLTIR